jgi:hypothetical protein
VVDVFKGLYRETFRIFFKKKAKKKPGEQVDLVAHLLASWPLYQLPRFFNTLLPVGGVVVTKIPFLTVSPVLPTFCRFFSASPEENSAAEEKNFVPW